MQSSESIREVSSAISMKRIIVLLFVVLFGCKSFDKNQSTSTKKSERVSLISVIANPEKFHNKTIVVEGYLLLEHEGDAIYVSKDDCTAMIQKNAVFLFIDYDSLAERGIKFPYQGYVRLEGVFNKNIKGSYDFYSGTFEKVVRVDRMLKRGALDEYYTD